MVDTSSACTTCMTNGDHREGLFGTDGASGADAQAARGVVYPMAS